MYYNWSNFAWSAMKDLAMINRMPGGKTEGEVVVIVADTNTDEHLANACLEAALRLTPNASLLVIRAMPHSEAAIMTPAVHNCLINADVIVALCATRLMQSDTVRVACENGARLISTVPNGIEPYCIRGVGDVDFDKMLYNSQIVEKLWNKAVDCRVTSEKGTDFSFKFAVGDDRRYAVMGDGAASQPGEVDFFPGIQVNVMPVEETVNGKIVIDASVSPGGLVSEDVYLTVENGKITKIEGGKSAADWKAYLEGFGDPKETFIYDMAHFSVGMNPQAHISGNMIEDERVVGAITLGFGNKSGDFGGPKRRSMYHVDAVIGSPTIYLDGVPMNWGTKLNKELGFIDME